MRTVLLLVALLLASVITLSITGTLDAQRLITPVRPGSFDEVIGQTRDELFTRGQQIFRFDTFGDERFWSDRLKLHQAIAGARLGGVGPGSVRQRHSRWDSRLTQTWCHRRSSRRFDRERSI